MDDPGRSREGPLAAVRSMTADAPATRLPRNRLGGRPAILDGTPAFQQPVYVTRPVLPSRPEYFDLLSQVFDRGLLTNQGPLAIELEQRLADYLEVPHYVSMASGTSALLTALRALDLSGEVITTPFTFPATPHCIAWNGLTPVFCDIDPDTYNIDVSKIEALITSRTTAILPVHVFGNPCDVEAIQKLAARYRLRVVYDAAHAFGVTLNGAPLSDWGDLSIHSFHATKVFHTAEGGGIAAPSKEAAEKLALLRNFGIVGENSVCGIGLNGKISELHAGLGLLVLDLMPEEGRRRAHLAARYCEGLSEIDGLKFQKIAEGTKRNHFNFMFEIERDAFGLSRDQFHEAMRAENIMTRKYFHPLCSDNESYRHLDSARAEVLPNATRVTGQVVSLPLYGALADDDVDAILDAIGRIRRSAPAIAKRVGERRESYSSQAETPQPPELVESLRR